MKFTSLVRLKYIRSSIFSSIYMQLNLLVVNGRYLYLQEIHYSGTRRALYGQNFDTSFSPNIHNTKKQPIKQ